MALHFSAEEFGARRNAACAAMAEAGLDALLCFRQETMYYLTGYDTFGYVFFQCLVLRGDGRMTLLTRSADLRQAQQTSIVEDIRIWEDREGSSPAEDLKAILVEQGLAGKRLGVEYDAYGLTAFNGKRLDATLQDFAELSDASLLVSRLRVVKSEAEIAYVRRAAELADAAFAAAKAEVRAGAFEGDVLAAMQGAVFSGGGDYSGNEFVIGSGAHALLCRYQVGRRHIEAQDQVTLEWAGVYRRYHAAMMTTVPVGEAPQRQREMHAIALEALHAVEDALKPGEPVGGAFAAHARVLDRHGMQAHRLNACGYSLGTTFAPNWMDWPMLYRDNPIEVRPGMVFFCHMIIFDSERGLAMTPGRTSLIGEKGAEPLTKSSLDLHIAP